MSVGHLARTIEAAGISTVIVAVDAFRRRLRDMSTPRLLITPHPMGRVLGSPGDSARQRAVLLAAFDLLEKAERAGTLQEMPGEYRPICP